MAVSSPSAEQESGLRRRIPARVLSSEASGKESEPKEHADVCATPADVPDDKPENSRGTKIGGKYALVMMFGFLIGLFFSPLLLPIKVETFDGGMRDTEGQQSGGTSEDSSEDMFDGYPRYNDPNDLHYADADLLIRTANRSQPLLQYMDNAMPDGEFADLQKCLRDHPMRHSNVNNEATFGATKGFIVSFNEEGISEVAQHPHFACLMPYFQRHRLPVANAWILNMVWAEVPKYDREFAIERHTDDALELEYPGDLKVLPYQTSVLYTFLPEDMEGGEIEAYPYEMSHEEMEESPPQGRVTPKLNRMAYFRGDAWHQVRSYKTKAKDVLRASLVLENYHIPINLEDYVVTFNWHDGKPEMM